MSAINGEYPEKGDQVRVKVKVKKRNKTVFEDLWGEYEKRRTKYNHSVEFDDKKKCKVESKHLFSKEDELPHDVKNKYVSILMRSVLSNFNMLFI